ncbi:uncharacterized protein [Montipora capricornis]|uniref:uncharacterized protein n=1 Tax=Montipora capricornis TaxID=246305 RepID=UPI0035F15015
MNTADASSLQEDVLLSEEPDVPSGETSATNYAILAVLQSLNKNMTEMGESLRSLKQKGETQTPKTAEPAKKRKSSSTGDDSDSQESDAEELFAANKRPKVVADKSNGSTCETSAEDESDSLLDEIAQSHTDTEKTAPKVTEKLAKIVNLRWLNKLDETNLKEKADKYFRPINCDRLITPKVNPEIWGRLDRQTRGKDLRLSNLQTILTKVGNITAKTTDMLLKARAEDGKVDVDNMVRMNTDALALLGHVSFEISQRRRDAIRPTLHKDYATLCASHVPITNFLFGDELQTQLNPHSGFKQDQQDALGQPVVQEVDSISTPLEETNRTNGPEVTSNIIATLGNTPVSEFKAILPSLLEYFQGKTKTFKAGSLAAYSHQWQEITSDPEVLETVTGQSIDFATLPIQENPLMQTKLSEVQTESVDLEIIQLLKKGVIQPCQHEAGEFISPIFTRPKKDGSFRIILNLKCFNTNVAHYHFKMDNIWSAIRLMKPGCYMASVDLKDAYYSVSICKDHQKFLKFKWKGILYQFVCFPNGLALCPRKFTKLLKPVFSLLRQQGRISVEYIDDSWLMADNFSQCTKNVFYTISLLDKVGFVIHPEKSVLLPTQIITFLGFVLNSILILNFQLKPYVAYKPDPEAHAVNAFHISWKRHTFYAFPPLSVIQREGRHTVPTSTSPTAAPITQETSITGLPLVRELLASRGISTGAAKIIMQSWRTSTQKQYQTYHQRWQEFCRSWRLDPFSASLENGLEFLYHQYENGLSHSGINTARSALSTFIFLPDGGSFGNHPLVFRFLKGVYESRPSLPRYKNTWDVCVVLNYLKTLPPPEDSNL